MTLSVYDKFFALLRISLGFAAPGDFDGATAEEWAIINDAACRHTLSGIVFGAFDKLSPGTLPPRRMLLQWIGVAEKIKQRNGQLNDECLRLQRLLDGAGLECCILKGQGNAAMYPDPLLRTAGDIDIWVRPSADNVSDGESVIAGVRRRLASIGEGEVGTVAYHHIEWTLPDVDVEIHYRPAYLLNPFYNRRLQTWFAQQAERQFLHRTELGCTPTDDFNVVFLLCHLFHHFVEAGISLRQMTDYAVLLRRNEGRGKEELQRTIQHVGLSRFAQAVMWIMREKYDVPAACLVTDADEREGRFLLADVLCHDQKPTDTRRVMVRRVCHLIRHYTAEVLWVVPFRACYHLWRKLHN